MGVSLRQRIALDLHRRIIDEAAVEHPLRQLFWECTLRCNMKCRHCGSDCKVSAARPDMPFADFEKVLLGVREACDPHKVMVILTGGEPLMRQDLEKCGRRIYDLEFPWGIVSNGRLLSERRIDTLLASGMHSATVSLDGFEAEHNWMRGTADGFRFASRAVEILARESSIKFDVVTCVNNRNYESLGQFKEYLISLGLKSWRLFTVFPLGRAAADPELQLSSERFRGLMEFIAATRSEGRIRASYGCEGFLGGYEGKVRDNFFTCQAGISVGSVLADGSISACPSIRSDYTQGNIYEDDFVEVWQNRFGAYRDRTWMHTGECDGCRFWRWCRGGGMHLRDGSGKLLLCHMERLTKNNLVFQK